MVCQCGQNNLGAGVSGRTELYGNWCVSEEGIIWDLVCRCGQNYMGASVSVRTE